MVLGARTKDNKGSLLIYESNDLNSFKLYSEESFNDLGYMLECPDIIYFNDRIAYSFSPQGVKEEENRFKNIFSSGYTLDKITKENYKEWDLGYDFYAPQSFVDSKGRRILLGWAGLDDNKLEYEYPVFNENFRHSLTLPRELKLINDRIYQYPIKEILDLFDSSNTSNSYDGDCFLIIEDNIDELELEINDTIKIVFSSNKLIVKLNQNGYGRKERSYDIDIKNVHIFNDVSITEFYINNGEYVFTTRSFSNNRGFKANKEVKYKVFKEKL